MMFVFFGLLAITGGGAVARRIQVEVSESAGFIFIAIVGVVGSAIFAIAETGALNSGGPNRPLDSYEFAKAEIFNGDRWQVLAATERYFIFREASTGVIEIRPSSALVMIRHRAEHSE